MSYLKIKNIVKIGVISLILINVIFLSTTLLGYIIGKYYDYNYNPVMIPGDFISSEEGENGYTIISYSALKVRDCSWVETKWFFGNPEDRANGIRIPMYHGERPEIRDTGEHIWENTFINLPVEEIINNSYAIVTHSCNPFWDTESLLFIGDNIHIQSIS